MVINIKKNVSWSAGPFIDIIIRTRPIDLVCQIENIHRETDLFYSIENTPIQYKIARQLSKSVERIAVADLRMSQRYSKAFPFPFVEIVLDPAATFMMRGIFDRRSHIGRDFAFGDIGNTISISCI